MEEMKLDRDNSLYGKFATRKAKRAIRVLFMCLFFLQIMVNFDNGAVPALLSDIKNEFHISPFEEGLVAGLQYVGLTGMSPISGMILQSKWKKQYILGTVVMLNGCAILLLPVAPGNATWLVLLSRLLVGISQATYLVFAPVWVDEFSPNNKKALWMSLCQAGIPLGIMVGYGVSGAMRSQGLSWKVPFFFQGGTLLPFGLALFMVPTEYLDVDAQQNEKDALQLNKMHKDFKTFADDKKKLNLSSGDGIDERKSHNSKNNNNNDNEDLEANDVKVEFPSDDNDDDNGRLIGNRVTSDSSGSSSSYDSVLSQSSRPRADSLSSSRTRVDSLMQYVDGKDGGAARLSILKQVRILFRSKVFTYTSLSLCSLFFVVTGIQVWITKYLEIAVKADYGTIIWMFTLTSATAPTLGVFFGGWFCEKLGGYRGEEGLARASKLVVCFGLLAVGSAAPAGFYHDLNVIISLIWLLLFWGGAIMPTATGLILSSVPVSLRSFSSAVSMFLYNMLGYALGATLPGFLQTQIQANYEVSTARVLAWGIRLVLCWSIFGLVFGGLAAWYAHKDWKKVEAGGSNHFQRLRKKRRRMTREVNDIVIDAINGDQNTNGRSFDGTISFGANDGDDDNFDTYDDEDINDLSTIDDEESSFRSNVTTDDINYEISRQYNPVFTGGANVIREVAHSFVDDTDFFQNARKGRRTSYSLT